MSDIYIQRMKTIRDDLDIASATFEYVRTHWHTQEVANAFKLRTQARVQRAEDSLEITYFVRLTAEFEGILKDHLRTNHPKIMFPPKPSDWKLDWFLARVVQREKLTIPVDLRDKLNEVRDYRNAQAHGNAPGFIVTFKTALARYNTFLDKLPEPRS